MPKTYHSEELKTWNCPKCSALLEISGYVLFEGSEFPTFQCDNESCVEVWEFDGSVFPAAYTFFINRDGRPVAANDLLQKPR